MAGLGVCEGCPAGKYSNLTNVSNLAFCSLCEAGRSTDKLDGQHECKLCRPGFYLPEFLRGRQDCLPCEGNQISGGTSCKGCPAGKSGYNGKISECKNCTPGLYSLWGQNPYMRRGPRGYYSKNEGLDSYTECLACPEAGTQKKQWLLLQLLVGPAEEVSSAP